MLLTPIAVAHSTHITTPHGLSLAPLPALIAHRGASRECPENTLPAFERALARGADGIELDVHATRDGVVVVHHDPTPHQPPNGIANAVPFAQLDHSAVRAMALADGERIPSLSEVLELVGDSADLFVEIKGHGIEQQVVRTIRGACAPGRCAIHSFDHRAVRRARDLAPEVRGGILLSSYLVDTVTALRGARATDLWQWWEHIDQPIVDEIHAAGGRVIAWTVNDPGVARSLASMGVDGLCTDDVRLLSGALAHATA
jgi:glycerophosphoryl diester phosphodiesterase